MAAELTVTFKLRGGTDELRRIRTYMLESQDPLPYLTDFDAERDEVLISEIHEAA